MTKILDKSHAKEICKLGKGDECCAYLVMGRGGFECAKGTGMEKFIELRLAEGTMNAKGDNCQGITEALATVVD